MTEDKGCKNCDALGIDSEIGVYYCCLSHRQDDLPKEFICDDYTPNKQLKRLEQENKELKKENETINYQWHKQSEIGDEWYKIAEKYKFVLEEINLILDELKQQYDYMTDYSEIKEIQEKINEVLE